MPWSVTKARCPSLDPAFAKVGRSTIAYAERLRRLASVLEQQLGRCACRPTLGSFKVLAYKLVGQRPTAVVWRTLAASGSKDATRVARRAGEPWRRSYRRVVAKQLKGKPLRLQVR